MRMVYIMPARPDPRAALPPGSGVNGYRADIDGLRGIAILAVVAYHFDLLPLGGGFVGVDVFFVISGFLITRFIVDDLDRGGFSFVAFYERRIRRLAPALFVVLATTLGVGVLVLLPTDLIALGKSTLAMLLFLSNAWFWRNEGYFESPLSGEPLLHTWSLAAEEQFYLVYPLVLLVVLQRFRQHARVVLAMLGVVSLALCIAVQPHAPIAAFYLTPARGWEFAVGGLLALGAFAAPGSRPLRETLAIGGGALLIWSFVAIAPGPEFPGWIALAPVVGTALLIHSAGAGPSLIGSALSWAPLVGVGLVSYSFYLWHWPALVFLKIMHGPGPLSGAVRWGAALALLGLSYLSYRYLEQPVRRRTWLASRARLFGFAAAGTLSLGLVAGAVALSDGLPGRFTPEVVALDRERVSAFPYDSCLDGGLLARRSPYCEFGADHAPPSAMLWGDSHALAWLPAFDRLFKANGIRAVYVGRALCPPLKDIRTPYGSSCRPHNDAALEYLQHQPGIQLVVMAAAWPSYSSSRGDSTCPLEDASGAGGNEAVFPPALRGTVDALLRLGKQAWVVGPTPGAPGDLPLELATRRRYGLPYPEPISRAVFDVARVEFEAAVAALPDSASVLYSDPTPAFCAGTACAYRDGAGLFYRSDSHLNVHGASAALGLLESGFVERACFGLAEPCVIIAAPLQHRSPP